MVLLCDFKAPKVPFWFLVPKRQSEEVNQHISIQGFHLKPSYIFCLIPASIYLLQGKTRQIGSQPFFDSKHIETIHKNLFKIVFDSKHIETIHKNLFKIVYAGFGLYNLQVFFHMISERYSGSSFLVSASFSRTDLTNAGSLRLV